MNHTISIIFDGQILVAMSLFASTLRNLNQIFQYINFNVIHMLNPTQDFIAFSISLLPVEKYCRLWRS